MVTKWKITVGLLLILFCGCSQVKELHESSTIISFKEHTDVNADSILELSFLKLQTKDSCLVKNVGLIRELNNCLLILDSANSNLYVFNKSGAFVNQIGQKGSGPGE
ncbi:putative exported protein, partial [Bacteroides fragilis str. Korea 419]